MKKVLTAMSGGVDSSVAAHLIMKQGYECIGGMMLLHSSEADTRDAASVAKLLGIDFHVFNCTEEFEKEVITRFISAYERGQTPNPCVDCNRYLKFGLLYKKAAELGCEYIASGHYARIEYDSVSDRYLLKKALDPTKDQSYMLYSLSQEQLSRTLFPLGNMTKAEARTIAEQCKLANAHKKDSQDICFVPNGDYASVIESFSGKKYSSGNFVDNNGKVLGQHKGIIHYTVGQRKGLGLALPEPMYVQKLDVEANNVILAKDSELYSKSLDVTDFNWSATSCPTAPIRAKVKVRYRHQEQWATITPLSSCDAHIAFDEAQRAITPGQSAVVYDGDTVIGGGIIK